MSMKNPNEPIGNRPRACSKVPQLNAPPRHLGGRKGTPKTFICPNYSGVLRDKSIHKTTCFERQKHTQDDLFWETKAYTRRPVLRDKSIHKTTPIASDHIVTYIQRWKAVSMEARNAEKVKLIWWRG